MGFTSATGAAFENHDILSWTFTPQAQSAPITNTTGAVLNFNGGVANNNTGYDYTAILTAGNNALTSAVVKVERILIDEESCEKLVDANPQFGHAQCFVFQNADGKGNSGAVLFELTCPGFNGSPVRNAETPASITSPHRWAPRSTSRNRRTLGSSSSTQRSGPTRAGSRATVELRGIRATGPKQPELAAVPEQPDHGVLSARRSFGHNKRQERRRRFMLGSHVRHYGRAASGDQIAAPLFTTTYKTRRRPALRSYTCSNPITSKDPTTSAIGPYLTVNSCTQSQSPNPNGTRSDSIVRSARNARGNSISRSRVCTRSQSRRKIPAATSTRT